LRRFPDRAYACAIVRARRRLLLFLAAVAALVAVAQALTGDTQLVLYAGPVLLLSDRFVGEEWIVARRTAALPRRRMALRRRWSRDRDRALTSLLGRSPRLLRGPPALLAARS
jgi:hypothetical protein